MRATIKAHLISVIPLTVSLLVGGCVTGPKYEYVQKKDSARIEPPVKPVQHIARYGSCSIVMTRIDGLGAHFEASSPGVNWAPGGDDPLYVAPGSHALMLNVEEIDEVYGVNGRNIGAVGASVAASQPTLTAEFLANHVYRLTADLNGGTIEVTLWDETAGSSARSEVAIWTLDSNRNYTEDRPPVQKR
jgi:hypothetical protein